MRQTADVAVQDSWRWLRNGFLKKETEGLILAAQEQALKGTSGLKKLAQMKEHEKCKKIEPSLTLMCQMVLEISHFKVRTLSKMDVAIL